MNKFVYFMAVGLAFTALQVATVSAQSGSGAALTIGDPACITVPAAAGCPPGSPGLMAPPTSMPPTMAPPTGTTALTIGDERCTVANEMRDTRCPNYTAPTSTGTTGGDTAAKLSFGERVKSIFGMDTKATAGGPAAEEESSEGGDGKGANSGADAEAKMAACLATKTGSPEARADLCR
jgi:hypothetical protein